MASSSDPEKDSNKSQSKTDNPFIKFRQFADQHISSLLQGIIGLPSAFSGKASENPRWAVFDEDLRRRDELQAKQKELKDSEAQRVAARGEEEDIPVKKSPDWAAFARWHEDGPTEDEDNDGMRDVPLYSPVTKSLFAHLGHPDSNYLDWKQKNVDFGYHDLADPWLLRPSERSRNALKTAQHLIYHDLNASSVLRSDYSVLPYVMFSPYSPLRLIENMSRSPRCQERDTFPYVDAFQDLIRTTQPPPKRSPLAGVHYPDSDLPLFDSATRASIYYRWIYWLHDASLLQESENRVFSPHYLQWLIGLAPVPVNTPSNSASDKKATAKEAQTEQEMYEHFLRWATQPNEKLEAVAAEAKAMYAKELESGKAPDIIQLLSTVLGTKSVTKLFEEFDEMFESEKRKQPQERTETTRETANSTEEPKIVSERTVTQRVKEVDGSVRTYVSICKVYADGREEVTETSHTEEPDRDEQGNAKPLTSIADQAKPLLEKAKAEEAARAKNATKKGWFWN